MIKDPYTEQFYTYHSKFVSNVLALRPPQKESLERFARLCDILSLDKLSEIKTAFAGECAKITEKDPEKAKTKRDQLVSELSARYQPICEEDLSKVWRSQEQCRT